MKSPLKGMAAMLAVLLSLAPTARGSAANTGAIALESIRDTRDIADASVSPDGHRVAMTVVSSTAEGGQTHIWLTGRDADAPRQLTFSADAIGKGESEPAWSPDGKSLFFRSTSGGMGRISRLSLRDGSLRDLELVRRQSGRIIAGWEKAANPSDSVEQQRFAVSPDGHWIAIIGDQKVKTTTSSPHWREPLDDAFEVVARQADKPRLYLLRLSTMQAREMELGDQVQSLAWSPDSRELIVVTGEETDKAGYVGHAWLVSLADSTPQSISGISDTVRTAVWRRGGLAYLARCEEEAPPECLQLFAWDSDSRASRALTRGLRGSLRDNIVVDGDGQHVVMPIMVGLTQRLARIDLRDGRLEWIGLPQPVALQVASNAARSAWVVLASGPATPKAILLANRLGKTFTALALPALVPPNWPTATASHLTWSRQGLPLEGLLYLPKEQLPTLAPLIVWVHGGPYSAFQDRYYRLVNVLVSRGWAVLIANPRGSMGYGAAFASTNRNDLGGADYADIMAGVDAALARFPLDPERMAMIGYSYGGTMVAFAEGRTDRFKALVAGAPVINQFSEYGTEDSSFDDRWYLGKPWEQPASAWRQSPLAHVASARTPLLLLQGQDDEVDPITQSEEMHRAMLQVGVPVTRVIYPRETHGSLAQAFGLGSSREPFHGLDLARRMTEFLSQAFAGNRPRLDDKRRLPPLK